MLVHAEVPSADRSVLMSKKLDHSISKKSSSEMMKLIYLISRKIELLQSLVEFSRYPVELKVKSRGKMTLLTSVDDQEIRRTANI